VSGDEIEIRIMPAIVEETVAVSARRNEILKKRTQGTMPKIVLESVIGGKKKMILTMTIEIVGEKEIKTMIVVMTEIVAGERKQETMLETMNEIANPKKTKTKIGKTDIGAK